MFEARLEEIAAKFGTPIYVYDLRRIDEQLGRLNMALPEVQIHYAVKANPNRAMLCYLAGQGLGAEVLTLGELERALLAGFSPGKLLLGGPAQHLPMIGRALEAGVSLVSLDSASQLALWEAQGPGQHFLLRLNPGLDPQTHEHLATGKATSKFGMPLDVVINLAGHLSKRGLLAGFHVHVGSQIEEIGIYDEILALLRPLYERFKVKFLDIGGGFAVPGFPLEAFAARVRGFAGQFDLELIIEPGRYLVAPAGFLLTRVLHVKEGAVKHVISDAGMAELLRPALYGANHPIRLVGNDARPLEQVDIDGPLCENADRLGRDIILPSPRQGDLLVVEQAGAYGFAMASNYASRLRPAEVVIDGEEVRLVRRRERVEDLVRLEDV